MVNRRKLKVTSTRKVNTYLVLLDVASESLRHANEDDEGRFFDCVSCLTFCALSLEAYFNHVGSNGVKHWELIERKLSPIDKLKLLGAEFGFDATLSNQPFSNAKELFKFRSDTVHGKTQCEVITEIHKVAPNDLVPTGRTKWETFCSLANTKRIYGETEAIMKCIHAAVDDGSPLWLSPTECSYRASEIE